MFIIGVFIIFDACHLQLSGIIRGIGMQKHGMVIGIIVFILIQTATNVFLVFYLNKNIYSLWYCQIVCAIIAIFCYYIYLMSRDWNTLAKKIYDENAEVVSKESNDDKLAYDTQIAL
jgi:Na+-driven multidrug efflux pump